MALVVVQSMADVSDSVCRYKCIQFTCFIEQSVLEQLQHREKETCRKAQLFIFDSKLYLLDNELHCY